jgi:hypothetical protein
MLLEIDKVFLNQFVSLSYMGKPVSAIGLYKAGVDCDETASLVHKNILLLSDKGAQEEARNKRDRGRAQTVIVAKLLGELVGALEDLGALCYSIKNRKNESIFKRYCLSQSEHIEFYKYIVSLSDSNIELSAMLDIPTLNQLRQHFATDDYKYDGFKQLYQQSAIQIRGAAELYRQVEEDSKPTEDKAHRNDGMFYVICDAINTLKPRKRENRGTLVRTYNKIKHRFLVFEDYESLKQAIEKSKIDFKVTWTTLSIRPNEVEDIYKMVMGTSQCMFTIAGLLVILDDNSVDL